MRNADRHECDEEAAAQKKDAQNLAYRHASILFSEVVTSKKLVDFVLFVHIYAALTFLPTVAQKSSIGIMNAQHMVLIASDKQDLI